jgi:uncharacterized membrane protein YjjP (DUF1212 family)
MAVEFQNRTIKPHGAGIAADIDAFKIGASLSRHKFCSLFVYLLLVLILYPYVNEGSFGDFVFRVIGGFSILLLTVYAISLRRTRLIFGILLAIPAILQRALLTDGQTYTGWRF